jgi:hypothetical protein
MVARRIVCGGLAGGRALILKNGGWTTILLLGQLIATFFG